MFDSQGQTALCTRKEYVDAFLVTYIYSYMSVEMSPRLKNCIPETNMRNQRVLEFLRCKISTPGLH